MNKLDFSDAFKHVLAVRYPLFKYRLSSEKAPKNYADLRAIRLGVISYLKPLPIENGFDFSLYGNKKAAFLFNVWHGLARVKLNCGFNESGEIKVATLMQTQLLGLGYPVLMGRMIYIDVVSRAMFASCGGKLEQNHAGFIEAVERELNGDASLTRINEAVETVASLQPAY